MNKFTANKCHILLFSFLFLFSFIIENVYGFGTEEKSSENNDKSKVRIYEPTVYSFSEPFKVYDMRTNASKKNQLAFTKVTILGLVRFPGIYLVEKNVTNQSLIQSAGPTGSIDSGAFKQMNYLKVFTKNNHQIEIEETKLNNFLSETPADETVYFMSFRSSK